MGSVEGDIQIAPINGRFLFAQPEDKALATMDPRFGKRMNQAHAPYNDESLANAIRRGVNNSGHEMNAMMPRYALGDREMKALIAYLGQLSKQWSPGVSAETIHFATIVTPDVEPERRKVLLSWSSGKDSSLALYELQKQGYKICALLTTITQNYDRVSMHGVRTVLLEQQASSIGCPLEKILISAGAPNSEYESKMREVLEKYQKAGKI